jgi:AcrR family transcriptional regulator
MNRETKKALTKQQLIASATALFRENGIHNTDLKSIAADAGVSVVTFYKYFDSKDTLVREIANDELNNLFDRIMAIADSPDLTILDKIKAFATLTATAQKKIATTYGQK